MFSSRANRIASGLVGSVLLSLSLSDSIVFFIRSYCASRSLTAGLLANFLAPWLSRKPALIIGGLGVVFYCLLAGLNPPIVRAGIMALILYLACFWGREAVGLWLLLITAAIMIIIDPFLPF